MRKFSGRPPSGRAGRASPEPVSADGLGHSATIPSAERLKLDRRIHNQRLALRENWEIVEQRRRGMRSFSLALIRSGKRLCDLLGIPEKAPDGLGYYALLYRMQLAAQGIETEGRDREAGLGAEHESPVAEDDAPIPNSPTPRSQGHE